ncbi:MarR family winged helix-turn-helix transcriptional regulator [Gordonia sp. NPDC003424]
MAKRRILEDDLGFLIARVSALLVKTTNRTLAPLGLKVRAYSVLAAVCDEPTGITQRRLASDVGLDPSQIVALVDDLEGRDLVVRTTDPDDRRNKLILATDGGRELCERAHGLTKDVARELFVDADREQLETLRSLLYRTAFDTSDS